MNASRPSLARGAMAPDFDLPGIDGHRWTYAQAAGPKGLVLMFICNHCPYVKAVADRIAFEAQAMTTIGVGRDRALLFRSWKTSTTNWPVDDGFSSSSSLLPGFGSSATPVATMAVLVSVPVEPASTVPAIVKVMASLTPSVIPVQAPVEELQPPSLAL